MAKRIGAPSYCENSALTGENVKGSVEEAIAVALLSQPKSTLRALYVHYYPYRDGRQFLFDLIVLMDFLPFIRHI